MFDNPKQELQRLEDALRELAEPVDDENDFSEEEDSEEDDWALTPGKNEAVNFSRMVYADEDPDIYAAAPVSKRQKKRAKKQEKIQKKKDRKKKRNRFRITLAAVLEIAAIIFLIRWWLQWLT